MKFTADYSGEIEHRILSYNSEEHSFDMEPITVPVDFDVIVNKLNLSVVEQKIVQIWGFCGLANVSISDFKVPKSSKGALLVVGEHKHGFAYGVSDTDYPVHVNADSGWVCIGDQKNTTRLEAVEFIDNCLAVLDRGKLMSIWLKPNKLPGLLLHNSVIKNE